MILAAAIFWAALVTNHPAPVIGRDLPWVGPIVAFHWRRGHDVHHRCR